MSLRDREPTAATLPETGLERRSQTGVFSLVAISENGTTAHPLRWGMLVIGRGNGVDIGIESPSVSRRYARLFAGERVRIDDLGSRIRGAPLHPGELAELGSSDLVELGSSVSMGVPARPSERQGQTAENALPDLARMLPRFAKSSVSVIFGGETGRGNGSPAACHAQLREIARKSIIDAPESCAGNQSRAARVLRTARGTFIA